jgi:hypothetical protein
MDCSMRQPTISRDASGRLTVEVFDIPMEQYAALCQRIATDFGLTSSDELVTNVADVAFMDFTTSKGALVEIAWDNWSGFIVTAKSTEDEPLIHRIKKWFDEGNNDAAAQGRTRR